MSVHEVFDLVGLLLNHIQVVSISLIHYPIRVDWVKLARKLLLEWYPELSIPARLKLI